jgi:hypothetical protein
MPIRSPARRAIPTTPAPGQDRLAFDQALKENIERVLGPAGQLQQLPSTATTADIVAALNIIIARLQ